MVDFIKEKRHYIMAIAIMFVVVSLTGPTYSLFFKADSTNSFEYNTGILDLQFIEDEQINIQNAFPVIDSDGLKNKPYTLTIKNTGSLPYLFDLKMIATSSDSVIDAKYIKYQVNYDKPNTLYTTNNIITSSILLYPNEQRTFKVKVWLDRNTPNNELGKNFSAKLVTSGQAVYKTLDQSGANHPNLVDDMIPVYYDETAKAWKKADASNNNESYEWYNYDNQKWANTVKIDESTRKIYDITRNSDLNVTEAKVDNGNYLTDTNYLDIGYANYNYNNISNIFRIKFNDLKENKVNIISNGQISYYYDTNTRQFILKVGNAIASSNRYDINKNKWYTIGYTYDTKQVSFYANGTKLATNNLGGTIRSNDSFKVGTDSTFKERSNIEIGGIYIYKNILTAEQINDNYKESIEQIIYDGLLSGYNDFQPRTLKEYYMAQNMGVKIAEKDVLAYYVWIPRFKYKLWNATGSIGIDSYDAYNKGIDIIFENRTESSGVVKCQNNICYSDDLLATVVTDSDNGKYYTHPAFTNNETNLTGLWVSKYEVSTNNEKCNNNNTTGCLATDLKIESIPGNTAWRNNYLSYFYQSSKRLSQDNNYHIIKNSEWGAITYLAHSKYGVCQNGKCNPIEANKTYTSGANLKDTTTGNIYGVFDMAGGASEFVMASLADANNKPILANTHFENTPLINTDYDLYQKNTFILGDATKEIALSESTSWDNSSSNFINETNNWFVRGGNGVMNNTGIFYSNRTTDTPSEYIGTRIVVK